MSEEIKKKTVKLKNFFFSNYKAIGELSAEVNGNHFMVVGKNGDGKTSIEQGLDRNAVRLNPSEIAELPIKFGSKTAIVKSTYIIDEDGTKREVLIETKYRPSGAEVKVVDLSNSGQLTPPIETIQKLLGESHNVTELMDLSPDRQFEKLLEMLGGKLSLENFELEYDQIYERRKQANRRVKDKQALVNNLEPTLIDMQAYKTQGLYADKKPLPPEPDDTAIYNERVAAENKNLLRQIGIDKKQAIEERILELKKQLEAEEAKLVVANKWLSDNPEIDLRPFDDKMETIAEEHKDWEREVEEVSAYNEKISQISLYLKNQKELQVETDAVATIQAELDAVSEKMRNAIAEFKIEEICPMLAVEHTKIETEFKTTWKKGLFYRHESGELLPFHRKQISYGKMIVALAQLSGYINAGKYNVFSIQSWRELDAESQKEILDFAENNEDLGIQFLVEVVEDRPLGIKIIERKP